MAKAKEARTPEYVRKMDQYLRAVPVLDEAAEASKTITEEISDEESAAATAAVLTTVSKAVKAADKLRLDASEPYRRSTDNINAAFKERLAPLEAVEERLKKSLKDYNARRRREQEEAERRHREEVRKAEEAAREAERKRAEAAARQEPPPPEPEPAPPPPPPPPPAVSPGVRHTGRGSVSGREEWKFEIFDPALVPAAYKVIDESLIRKAVKEGAREIAGVRIYPDESIHVR